MEVKELSGDILESYRSRSSFWVPDVDHVFDEEMQIKWALGPIFSERVYENLDSEYNAYISEASATCVATQIRGSNPGQQAIVKIRMHSRTDNEAKALAQLTARGSTCTPKWLGHMISEQEDDDPVPGGFLRYLIMEKVPGRDLSNFGDLPMTERNQVRLAFAKAIREFHTLGYDHKDKANHNLIWDRENKKCYIIDLEDAVETTVAEPFMPGRDFYDWEIAGPEPATGSYGVDPMVPCDFQSMKSMKDPGDAVLEEWAAETSGKEVLFPEYDLRTGRLIKS